MVIFHLRNLESLNLRFYTGSNCFREFQNDIVVRKICCVCGTFHLVTNAKQMVYQCDYLKPFKNLLINKNLKYQKRSARECQNR